MKRQIKVLHAPMNFANQAQMLNLALKERGVNSTSMVYQIGRPNSFGFEADIIKQGDFKSLFYDQFSALADAVQSNYNIIHFWNRSFIYRAVGRGNMLDGIDLPILKGTGVKLVHRFTGYELRRKSEELALNPYTPYRYGYENPYTEEWQHRYLDHLRSYIDEFVVQDPEMGSYLPEATVLPRTLNIDAYEEVPARHTDRPVIAHAPTSRMLKGSEFVIQALDELKEEGLTFDLNFLEGLPHAEALEQYRQADIVVDQLLIGWYGVVSMEAMAYGKPVIAYIRPDLEASFADGVPLINANPDTIKDKLRLAITDFDYRREIGEQGRRHVENTHDSRVVARQAEDLYRRLLRSRRGRKVRPNLSFQISEAEDFSDLVNKGLLARSSFLPELMKLRGEVRTLKRRLAETEELADADTASAGPSTTTDGAAANSSAPEQGDARADRKEPGDVKQQVTPSQPSEATKGDEKRRQPSKRSKVHLVAGLLRAAPAVLSRTIHSMRRLRGPKRRGRVLASAVTGDGREGPHICILSRKDLRSITRVPRMAKALCDAGFRVTVISLKPPVQELQEATPGVRYIGIQTRPTTVIAYAQRLSQFANQSRQAENARKAARERSRHRLIPRLRQCVTWPLRAILGAVLGVVREILVVLPSAFLLKTGEETFRAKLKELRALHVWEIVRLYVLSLRQIDSSYQFGNGVLDALQDEAVSVVQAHDNYALVASDMLAAAKNAPIVSDAVELSEHRLAVEFNRFERLRERYERWEEGRIMGRCARWITVSDGLANWYQKRFKVDRPLVVRNCRYFWSSQEDRRLREDCGLKDGEHLVVWFGQAYPQQGLTLLVDVASLLPEYVHIAIVAAALPRWVPYVESLSERAGQAGTGARVHVLPARDPNDLISYVSGADIGIIPRPSEYLNNYYSMPNKFLEMVMARLPIVVSRVGDMVDLMNHYDIGEVFDETRIESLVEVVARVLEPEQHARLKANVEEAAKELNWERESRPYVQMMDELTGRDGLTHTPSDSVPAVATASE